MCRGENDTAEAGKSELVVYFGASGTYLVAYIIEIGYQRTTSFTIELGAGKGPGCESYTMALELSMIIVQEEV